MMENKFLLVDVMPFEITPELIKESAQRNNGKLMVQGTIQRANSLNQNKRRYPKNLLEREVQKYIQLVKERRALGELDHPDCLCSSAEILTSDGWKLLSNVSVGENVFTLDTDTDSIKLNPIQRVINQPYKGKMISIKGKNINTLVTPNHRFILKDRKGNFIEKAAQEIFELSKQVSVSHLTIPIVSENWDGENFDTYELPRAELKNGASFEDKERQSNPLVLNAESWFSFLGFYLAEGHCASKDGPGYGVHITQNVGEIADKFREILKNLSSELNWTEISKSNGKGIIFNVYDARLWAYLDKLGNKYEKYIPGDIKNASPKLLTKLFEWFLLGDGTTVIGRDGYERQSIFSVSKKLIEDFNEVLIKLGGVGVIKEQNSKKDYLYANRIIEVKNKSTLYRLYIKKSQGIHLDFRFISVEEVDYDSTVHCVTVENGTFYCRDQGSPFWSGNSSVINLQNVSHLITELWWEGDDLMGTVEVLSTPSGNILKALFESGVKVGISSRGLGSTREIGEGAVEVQDDYEILGWDMVSNPSTQGGFMNKLNESVIGVARTPKQQKLERVNKIVMDILSSVSENI